MTKFADLDGSKHYFVLLRYDEEREILTLNKQGARLIWRFKDFHKLRDYGKEFNNEIGIAFSPKELEKYHLDNDGIYWYSVFVENENEMDTLSRINIEFREVFMEEQEQVINMNIRNYFKGNASLDDLQNNDKELTDLTIKILMELLEKEMGKN
ncbi:hypothetical protein [Listeria phage LP-KV022]|uniref:Uncharacterized protein n=2 Tax=Homburgvirus LP110 TaxID=1921128 RepID=A0A5A4K346_9CAUD|nr:hypothetical protein LP110_005 [Listeria phage LP-110]AGI11508.1 hypothetical protein LP110_005 [Listeria phage LP-110]AWY07699.1 hypothetical protein [Listeria phage LP-KV022]